MTSTRVACQIEDEMHYKASKINYRSKEFDEYSHTDENQLKIHLNEEFTYSYRMISLVKNIFGKLVHYFCDFYINKLQSPKLNTETLKDELYFETAVPYIGFINKDEFVIYKEKFGKFQNEIIKELMARRYELGIMENPDIEYLITNLFIPIKKVLDYKS